MNAEKKALLRGFTVEELKEELAHRRTLERAKKYLPSAEEALKRAQAKVDAYRSALEEDKAVLKKRLNRV